jgi:hypothetical protein
MSWSILFDAGWWVTKGTTGLLWWAVFGRQKTTEEKKLDETNDRLQILERQMDQIYAFQTHRSHIEDNLALTQSICVVPGELDEDGNPVLADIDETNEEIDDKTDEESNEGLDPNEKDHG